MSSQIYVYSKVFSSAIQDEGRDGLEDDLEDFLGEAGEAGEVSGGGGGDRGWNVDLEMYEDPEDWVGRICEFLRGWGVAEDTYLCVYPEGWSEGTEPRRVMVFGR